MEEIPWAPEVTAPLLSTKKSKSLWPDKKQSCTSETKYGLLLLFFSRIFCVVAT